MPEDNKSGENHGLERSGPDLDLARLWVARRKNGLSVQQPIGCDDLRAIRFDSLSENREP